MYFGNKSITIHLIRGVLGLGALYAALSALPTTPWLSVILVPVALFMLKGCPTCWTLGLVETVAMAIHRRVDAANSSDLLADRMNADEHSRSTGQTVSASADGRTVPETCWRISTPKIERKQCPDC